MIRILSALFVLAGVALTILSANVHRDLAHTNDFLIFSPVGLIAVLLSGIAAAAYLGARRARALGMLGVGLYLLIVAVAVSTVFPMWLPSDNTILGTALLAGMLAAIGAGFSIASAAVIAARSQSIVGAAGLAGGVLVFLAVTVGGVVYPLVQLRLPILSAAMATIAALALTHRHLRLIVRPLVLAVAGAACTIATLLLRGPGDWSSASTSVKLYSFPILLICLGVSLATLEAVRPEPSS